MGFKRVGKAKKYVEKRVADERCLVPKCKAANNMTGASRGLCHRHYQQLMHRFRSMASREQRIENELSLMKDGMLLDRHELNTLRRKDPFGLKETA
jgi:hypothetical protein